MHITSFEMEGVGEVKANTDAGDGERKRKMEMPKSQEVLVEDAPHSHLLYSLEDNPPWYTCLILGLQHFLTMIETSVSIPYLLTPLMCMLETDPARSSIASTIIFVSGVVTLLQTTVGSRLPLVMGGSISFLSPTLAILALMPCPPESEILELEPDARRDLWQTRMQQVQGAICVAALFQVVVGFTGAVSVLLRWITPLVIAQTVTLIGFSLCSVAISKAASHWGISSLTVVLLILFSQYLGNVGVPWFTYSRSRGFCRTKVFVFKLFPVLLAVASAWALCWLLTYLDVLPKDNHARTDLSLIIIDEAPWFRLPYPCQWGLPMVNVADVMGLLAGVLASIVESLGDYYACARLSGAPPPPEHAINRGIWIEGLGSVLTGLFGTGNGTTSYSQNIGIIGVTRVGSRRVVQYSAAVMLVCGVVGKVGALFITIPEPIIGGIFCVVFAMIISVGLSNVQFIDLNSSRNLFVLGFSLFFGVALPMWMQKPESAGIIATSLPMLDQVLSVLLGTPMVVGGFLGFVLDNTIPGTDEERGLVTWRAMLEKTQHGASVVDCSCYDLPFCMERLRKWEWTKFVPILPTFVGWGAITKKYSLSPPGCRKV